MYVTLAKDLTNKSQIIRRLIITSIMIPFEIIVLLTIPYYIFMDKDAFSSFSDLMIYSLIVLVIFGFTLAVMISEARVCIKRLKNKTYP